MFDADGSGQIDFRELKVAMTALGQKPNDRDIRNIMEKFDKDHSDTIDKDEFFIIMAERYRNRNPRDEIAKQFKELDYDNCGHLNLQHLQKLARELGETMTDADLLEIIDETDRTGTGEINLEDFTRVMKKTMLFKF